MSEHVKKIQSSCLTIYDLISSESDLWIQDELLQQLLQDALRGLSLSGMPPRTRSKFVKEAVCKALGYPIPSKFQKTKPRFICQNFDIYIQKSNNLQIWNEEISPERRYVIIQVVEDKIAKIKIINGLRLSEYDKTGTLTIKHQAIFVPGKDSVEILSEDTQNIKDFLIKNSSLANLTTPTDAPIADNIFSISDVCEKLKTIVGSRIKDRGFDQDRNRGAELHRLVCQHLGYSSYQDNGQFPDILNQMIEVKLQTSPTIDLGLVLPNSILPLRNITINSRTIRHCDIRYAVFYGKILDGEVEITHLSLTSGEKFFDRFSQMLGKTVNKKIQIPLPRGFFDS